MKKLMLVAAGVMAPLSFALADDKKEGEAAAATPAQAAGPTFPDWDQRKAGESLDLSGGKAATEKEK